MAKELPYYKHEPSEWLEGEIQICSDPAIVCFTNLRDGYWLKLGCMSYAFALHKYCRRDASIMQELIDNGIVDLDGDNIVIQFLDNQLKEFQDVSEKRKKAAEKRWKTKGSNASALQTECKSNAIREDKIKEDNNNVGSKEPLSDVLIDSWDLIEEPKKESIDYDLILNTLNEVFGFSKRVFSDQNKKKYKATFKQGYSIDNVVTAMKACKADSFHRDSKYKHCTIEYFSRPKTLDMHDIEPQKEYTVENPPTDPKVFIEWNARRLEELTRNS